MEQLAGQQHRSNKERKSSIYRSFLPSIIIDVTNLYRITVILSAQVVATFLIKKSNFLGLLVLPLFPPQRMSLLIDKFLPSVPSPFPILGSSWLLLYFFYVLVRILRSEAERFPLLRAGDPSLVDAGRGAGGVQLPGPTVS